MNHSPKAKEDNAVVSKLSDAEIGQDGHFSTDISKLNQRSKIASLFTSCFIA
jgi:hypothetical protein